MKLHKPNFWDSDKIGISSILLYPFSLIWRIIFLIKYLTTKKIKMSIPVICVGNIYIGGTGKTPLTIKLYELLKDKKRNPIIVKKFYKNQTDEINLLKNSAKVSVDSSRIKAINNSKREGFDVAILDDGLQDYSVKKDLKIVCFNSNQLIGNGMIIPSGPLREPIKSINNFDIVVINGNKNVNFEERIKKKSKSIKFFYTKYVPTNINDFNNKKILAFAGIGNPKNFFQILKDNNISVEKKLSFPDHYDYSDSEIKKIKNIANEKNLKIITTEKDFYRLKDVHRESINFLSLKLELINEIEFTKEVNNYL